LAICRLDKGSFVEMKTALWIMAAPILFLIGIFICSYGLALIALLYTVAASMARSLMGRSAN
jgi:uncharacterized membrane protein